MNLRSRQTLIQVAAESRLVARKRRGGGRIEGQELISDFAPRFGWCPRLFFRGAIQNHCGEHITYIWGSIYIVGRASLLRLFDQWQGCRRTLLTRIYLDCRWAETHSRRMRGQNVHSRNSMETGSNCASTGISCRIERTAA
jgi:hypothetical protein